MIEKLKVIEEKYEKILSDLENPDIISNQEEYRKLMKEHSELTPIVEKYREYSAAKESERQALEILGESGIDKELKEV